MQFLILLLAILTLSGSGARRKRNRPTLLFRDCGVNPERPLHFLEISGHPMPIVIPGTLYLNVYMNVTYELPRRMNVEMSVMKYIFGFPFIIPCIDNKVGSCTYENVCFALERYEAFGCPRVLAKNKIPCYCPFNSGTLHIRKLALNLPKVSGFTGMLIHGDYEMRARVIGEEDYELGCLELKFSMKKRHRGWLFKI